MHIEGCWAFTLKTSFAVGGMTKCLEYNENEPQSWPYSEWGTRVVRWKKPQNNQYLLFFLLLILRAGLVMLLSFTHPQFPCQLERNACLFGTGETEQKKVLVISV